MDHNTARRRRTIRDIRAALDKQAASFKKVFESQDGDFVLACLEEEFLNKNLAADNPHATIVAAAQADVIRHIHLLMRYEEGNDNA